MAPSISHGIYDMAFMILILRFPANIHGTRLDAEAHTADMAEKLQNTFEVVLVLRMKTILRIGWNPVV